MNVVWMETADKDLDEWIDYMEIRNPAVMNDVIDEIFEAVEMIQTNPLAGKVGKIYNTSEFVIPNSPMTIIYRFEPDSQAVVILYVHHYRRLFRDQD